VTTDPRGRGLRRARSAKANRDIEHSECSEDIYTSLYLSEDEAEAFDGFPATKHDKGDQRISASAFFEKSASSLRRQPSKRALTEML
jgi:hypothetical protein